SAGVWMQRARSARSAAASAGGVRVGPSSSAGVSRVRGRTLSTCGLLGAGGVLGAGVLCWSGRFHLRLAGLKAYQKCVHMCSRVDLGYSLRMPANTSTEVGVRKLRETLPDVL